MKYIYHINLKLLNLGQGSPLPCVLCIGAPVRFGIHARLQQIEIAPGNLASMLQDHLTLNNQMTQEKACIGLAVSPIVLEHRSLRLESLVAGEEFVLLANTQASKLSFSNLKILISASGQELLEHPSQVDSNEDSQFCCLSGLTAQKKHHCRHASRRVVRHAVGGVLGLKSTSPATLFAPCLLQVQFRRQPIHDKPTSSSSKNAAHITK